MTLSRGVLLKKPVTRSIIRKMGPLEDRASILMTSELSCQSLFDRFFVLLLRAAGRIPPARMQSYPRQSAYPASKRAGRTPSQGTVPYTYIYY